LMMAKVRWTAMAGSPWVVTGVEPGVEGTDRTRERVAGGFGFLGRSRPGHPPGDRGGVA
jgi:hypothetical protein